MKVWPDIYPQAQAWGVQRVLAMTAWGEARGNGLSAMADVMSVVVNRVDDETYWGNDIISVCLAEYQFSCWNGGSDPNRAKMIACPAYDTEMAAALACAASVVAGQFTDKTGGADSYFATSIAPPYWAKAPAKHTVTRGPHSFWITTPHIAPAISVNAAPGTADDLNAQYLAGYVKANGG